MKYFKSYFKDHGLYSVERDVPYHGNHDRVDEYSLDLFLPREREYTDQSVEPGCHTKVKTRRFKILKDTVISIIRRSSSSKCKIVQMLFQKCDDSLYSPRTSLSDFGNSAALSGQTTLTEENDSKERQLSSEPCHVQPVTPIACNEFPEQLQSLNPIKSKSINSYQVICRETVESETVATTADNTGNSQRFANNHVTGFIRRDNSGPLVVFVHGGGWQRGGRRAWRYFIKNSNLLVALVVKMMGLYSNVGATLASRGIATAVISYPLATLSGPWAVLDFVLSYFCSFLLFFILYNLLRVICSFQKELLVNRTDETLFGFARPSLTLVLVLTNVMILMTRIVFSHEYLSKYYAAFLTRTLPGIVGILLVHFIYGGINSSVLVFVVTFLLCLEFHFGQRGHRKKMNYRHQMEAMAEAVVFLKKHGTTTGRFDHNSLFLMGHSAGAHLVCLAALDQHYRERIGDIKGVISISGVYNLLNLSHFFPRHLYLYPAFGKVPSLWQQTSPMAVVKNTCQKNCPPFLVVTAQFDGHLQAEAEELCQELDRRMLPVDRICVPRTNHFTVAASFTAYAEECVKFIKRNYGSKNTLHQMSQ